MSASRDGSGAERILDEVVCAPPEREARHGIGGLRDAVAAGRRRRAHARSTEDGRQRTLLRGVLAFAILIGTFLRVYDINALGFNTDEAVYAGQAASIANDHDLTPYFPIFRAHPLLFQTMLSIPYQLGTSDVGGRLLVAAIGVATIVLVYRLGLLLYGPRAGTIAALLVAVMPYHVVVTRQVLLDGPLVFWSTLTLFAVAKFATTGRVAWLYVAAAAMGLTVLSKETAVLFVAAIYAFFALAPEIHVRLRQLMLSLGILTLVVLPYPLSVSLAGKKDTGGQFLAWQLFRRANHDWTFYPTEVPRAIGYAVIVAAIAGLWFLRGRHSWRETLLLCWIAVPAVFFQIWPVKGYQYLLPIAPAVALLAGRALAAWRPRRDLSIGGRTLSANSVGLGLTALVAITLLVPAVKQIQPSRSDKFLAGSGGVPGGREAGRWIDGHVPEGAQLLTVGPSMANILEFYGHRRAYGLSVSPNPLHRNPTYEPIVNPDLRIRQSDLQYVVWDAFSASRSTFFGTRLLRYVERYNGRAIHTESVTVDGVLKPVIRIFEVRP